MSSRKPTDLVNVDFWADRIAAVIKLAEHYGMTVEIAGRELVVSRRVSDAFTARTEVRWRPEPPADETQQPECPGYETVPNRCACGCEGCKHHCGAHQPADEAQQQPDTETRDDCCGAPPPELFIDEIGREWHAGDCWCTLPPDHDGQHRCQPCTDRVGAPGWGDEPTARAGQDGAQQ